jgi:NTF2-related export protein 1/2
MRSSLTGIAAEQFVETYYPALNNPNLRSKLTTFYIKPTPTAPQQADITLNGNTISDPSELQSFFENQVAKAQYEVGSFDCSVLNTNYNVGAREDQLGPDKDGKKMSILVMVSGSVKYWKDGSDSEVRGFTENVVLVPNWEAHSPKAAKGEKKWLIQSQNFRLVV